MSAARLRVSTKGEYCRWLGSIKRGRSVGLLNFLSGLVLLLWVVLRAVERKESRLLEEARVCQDLSGESCEFAEGTRGGSCRKRSLTAGCEGLGKPERRVQHLLRTSHCIGEMHVPLFLVFRIFLAMALSIV